MVQVVFQPALGPLVIKLAPSRGEEQEIVPGSGGRRGVSLGWSVRISNEEDVVPWGQNPDQPPGQRLLSPRHLCGAAWALWGVGTTPRLDARSPPVRTPTDVPTWPGVPWGQGQPGVRTTDLEASRALNPGDNLAPRGQEGGLGDKKGEGFGSSPEATAGPVDPPAMPGARPSFRVRTRGACEDGGGQRSEAATAEGLRGLQAAPLHPELGEAGRTPPWDLRGDAELGTQAPAVSATRVAEPGDRGSRRPTCLPSPPGPGSVGLDEPPGATWASTRGADAAGGTGFKGLLSVSIMCS